MMAINLKNLNKRIENVTASGEKLTTLAHSEEVPTKYIIPAHYRKYSGTGRQHRGQRIDS